MKREPISEVLLEITGDYSYLAFEVEEDGSHRVIELNEYRIMLLQAYMGWTKEDLKFRNCEIVAIPDRVLDLIENETFEI
jgi:hypothetical protein